ncbi:MAG TPA: YraN family protein, partial [Nitrospiraceae bacterium]|nr:YraN family protein [Nitrospiraceae bacterium]
MTSFDPRKSLGQEGEAAAEQYLRRKGYRIVARNLRSQLGELDLVAEDGRVLVFVEVKARRTGAFGGAIYAVHQRKQEKLIQLAALYLARHHIKDRLCRFDVVLLQAVGDGPAQIEH